MPHRSGRIDVDLGAIAPQPQRYVRTRPWSETSSIVFRRPRGVVFERTNNHPLAHPSVDAFIGVQRSLLPLLVGVR